MLASYSRCRDARASRSALSLATLAACASRAACTARSVEVTTPAVSTTTSDAPSPPTIRLRPPPPPPPPPAHRPRQDRPPRRTPPQVLPQRRRAGVALAWLLLQALHADSLQVLGPPRLQPPHRHRLVPHHLQDSVHRRRRLER